MLATCLAVDPHHSTLRLVTIIPILEMRRLRFTKAELLEATQ